MWQVYCTNLAYLGAGLRPHFLEFWTFWWEPSIYPIYLTGVGTRLYNPEYSWASCINVRATNNASSLQCWQWRMVQMDPKWKSPSLKLRRFSYELGGYPDLIWAWKIWSENIWNRYLSFSMGKITGEVLSFDQTWEIGTSMVSRDEHHSVSFLET